MQFKRICSPAHTKEDFFSFDGKLVAFHPGETIAGALLAAGVNNFRQTPVSASQRGPWCLMGVCFECLVRINGQDNQRACMTPATAGLRVERQIGARQDAMEQAE